MDKIKKIFEEIKPIDEKENKKCKYYYIQGPKGDDGKSEKISIVNTETIDSEKKAEVKDNFDGNTHNLTFLIPKGEIGPIGPQGLTGSLCKYL